MIDPVEEQFQCKECDREMEIPHNLCIDCNDKVCYDCCIDDEHSSERSV